MNKLAIKDIENNSLFKELPITLSTAAVIVCTLFMAVTPPKSHFKTVEVVNGVVGSSLLKATQTIMPELSSSTQTASQKQVQSLPTGDR
jgi:hypothetical protein